jgi:methoxymalonate biosynthesis protein
VTRVRGDPPARPAEAAPAGPAPRVKCVVWDIDNTLLTGVYLEAGENLPGADPVTAGVLAELGRRGILQAVASKNPPEAAAHAARATGCDFAAVECGWGAKSAALSRIAESLAIGADTLAFVDDDPYERAEVSAALPQVRVLAPEEAAEAVRWPEFSPPVLTEEGRRRGELYAARRRRLAAERGFGGSRDEFLRSVGTTVAIAAASAADAARLHELAVRTRQFNSAAQEMDEAAFAALIAAGDVVTVRLRDAFSDDGIVGGCVLRRPHDSPWSVPLLMMSCRAMGRGVIEALLAWLVRAAGRAGAPALAIPCLLTGRNVPLRLALAGAGFRASGPAPPPGTPRVFRRDVTGPPPDLPDWVSGDL